jgi:hypothetical protein
MFYSRFKPETLKKWRDKKFRSYWHKLSKRSGRPKDKDNRFVLIKQIIKENPHFSAEKIVELLKDLGIIDCPCATSIRKRINMSIFLFSNFSVSFFISFLYVYFRRKSRSRFKILITNKH